MKVTHLMLEYRTQQNHTISPMMLAVSMAGTSLLPSPSAMVVKFFGCPNT